jgi:hypothetical protein
MTAELARMRAEGGRVFTCDVPSSRAYAAARPLLGDGHELWTFAALLETLTPQYNLRHRVRSAYSPDLTMLVPEVRVLAPEEADCRSFGTLERRLREAGVAHVLSVDPLASPALAPVATVRPARVAPLAIHVYRLRGPVPLHALSGAAGTVETLHETEDRVELRVRAGGPATLLVRDGYAPGWSAQADGTPAAVSPANGRHLAVAVRAGESRVALEYRPLPARLGAALSLLAAVSVGLLWLRPRAAWRAAAARLRGASHE